MTALDQDSAASAPGGRRLSIGRLGVGSLARALLLSTLLTLALTAIHLAMSEPAPGSTSSRVVLLACDAVWAIGSGSLVGLLRTSARARRIERRASGGILIGLGVLATLAHPAKR